MVKKIIMEPGRTFQEFSLLTGYTHETCSLQNISLKTRLGKGLELKIPLLSAAMTSVTGYEMVLALGREGGLSVLPARLPVEEQADIIKRIKKTEMSFIENPVTVKDYQTVEEALKLVDIHGHSKIPITDKNNQFLGIFDRHKYWDSNVDAQSKVTEIMTSFEKKGLENILFCNEPNLSVSHAKSYFGRGKSDYLVVLDEQDRLIKVAFQKDIRPIDVGAAINTHGGWEKRVEKIIGAGVNLIVIDTSDGFNQFVGNVLTKYKQMKLDVPICAGNVITYEGAMYLMEKGADIIKTGMSSGSICSTQREKATGRAPMTALIETTRARDYFLNKTKKYIPNIVDGGVSGSADMIIALTIADAIMMGNYFNRFYEAAGEKLDKGRKVTRDSSEMVEVVTYGEGSKRAQNLARYGHAGRKTFFEEGVEGTVPYAGRLKPTLKQDLLKIRAALSNTGCISLNKFREEAVIELNSPYSNLIVGNTHDIKTN